MCLGVKADGSTLYLGGCAGMDTWDLVYDQKHLRIQSQKGNKDQYIYMENGAVKVGNVPSQSEMGSKQFHLKPFI